MGLAIGAAVGFWDGFSDAFVIGTLYTRFAPEM